MKTIYLLIIAAFCFNLSLLGQVDKIKEQAKKNKNQKSHKNGSDFDSDDISGACLDGCITGCFNGCFPVFINLFANGLQTYDENRDEYPRNFSFDVSFNAGFSMDNDLLMLPQLRGTYGVFRSDLRINYLAEFDNMAAEIYQTYDWQILQLRIPVIPEMSFGFGGGFMYEEYTEQYFPEASLFCSFSGYENLYDVEFSFRYASDENTTIRTETGIIGGLKTFRLPGLSVYTNLGFMYQNYYSEFSFFMITGGLSFSIQ